jgi:hypothetical protein
MALKSATGETLQLRASEMQFERFLFHPTPYPPPNPDRRPTGFSGRLFFDEYPLGELGKVMTGTEGRGGGSRLGVPSKDR